MLGGFCSIENASLCGLVTLLMIVIFRILGMLLSPLGD
jgi:hypothetical protein